MSMLGNLLWFVLVGFWHGIAWLFIGLLWCVTIIGMPIGVQCFKIATVVFMPFGKEVTNNGQASSFLLNILWIIFGGIELAVASVLWGIVLCITVVGIPFGVQCFKIAKISLMPFGTEIR